MRILYCRVGWMNSYYGNAAEKPIGGGKYNIENVGHEVYNYLGYKGKYYGFVEAGLNNGSQSSIHVENLSGDRKAEFADDVLVVWVARKPSGGQFIVGWYENAKVYRRLQTVPENVMTTRSLKDHDFFNVYSEHVFLIPPQDRIFQIEGMGHSNIWYGKDEFDERVISYIQNYDKNYEERIEAIDNDILTGSEKEAIVKVRVNQDKFRSGLIERYAGRCCVCGMGEEALLLASHIKPWSKSDEHEKLDLGNGLLLCPNHDRLFDKGYITFDDDGNIMISERLEEETKQLLNIDESLSVEILEGNREYIKYHREHIFE